MLYRMFQMREIEGKPGMENVERKEKKISLLHFFCLSISICKHQKTTIFHIVSSSTLFSHNPNIALELKMSFHLEKII